MRAVTTRRTLSKSYVPKERVINGPRYCLRSRPLQYCSCHLQRTSHLRKVVKEQRVFGAAGGLRSGGGVRDNGVPEGVDVAQVEQRREPLQLARLSGLANTKKKLLTVALVMSLTQSCLSARPLFMLAHPQPPVGLNGAHQGRELPAVKHQLARECPRSLL